jgi:TolA-binding protein
MSWMLAAAALLVVLGGSTAWAYWTGRLEGLFGDVQRESAPVEEAAPEPAPQAPRAREEEVAPVSPVVPAPSEENEAPSEIVESPSASRDEEPSVAPSEATIDPAERRAYREAHALHFEQHDDAAAIAAWDRYLATYPRGRFALEARYNRALCLVRAGRESEARAALTPFVQGTHGGYRQQEATEILEALDAQ